MGKQYERAPLKEAVCDFRFDPKSPWDDAIPGLVYERLQERFPLRKQATDARLLLSETPPPPRTARLVDRVRFFDEGETSCVQLGPHFLAVNQLPPYPSWEGYLPVIEQAISSYRAVADPLGLVAAELRYINHLHLPVEEFEFATYFNIYPSPSGDFPDDLIAFIAGAKFLLEESNAVLRVEMKSAIRNGESVVILDVYASAARPDDISLDSIAEWLNIAHEAVEDGFEASLTDELKETFGVTSA